MLNVDWSGVRRAVRVNVWVDRVKSGREDVDL